jgi:hypothetical protein
MPSDPAEAARLEAERQAAREAYLAAQADRKAKAAGHLRESIADLKRSLARALKDSTDPDRLEDHLKAARLALKAAEDAARRLRP